VAWRGAERPARRGVPVGGVAATMCVWPGLGLVDSDVDGPTYVTGTKTQWRQLMDLSKIPTSRRSQ